MVPLLSLMLHDLLGTRKPAGSWMAPSWELGGKTSPLSPQTRVQAWHGGCGLAIDPHYLFPQLEVPLGPLVGPRAGVHAHTHSLFCYDELM